MRREPAAGTVTWRRSDERGVKLPAFSVRREAKRLEVETLGWTARCEAENAAIAYPGLMLYERGPWAAAVDDWLDSRLPWWPQRSNQELAEMFDIETVPSPPAEPAGAEWLRFRKPNGDAGDYTQIAFSRDGGAPLAWQSYLDGQLVQTIRLGLPAAADGKAEAAANAAARPVEHAVLKDVDGRTLLEWQGEHSAEEPRIAALNAGWPDFLELQTATAESPLTKGLAAARSGDWGAAVRIFNGARQEQPKHPLLSLLWAWSVMRQRPTTKPWPREKKGLLWKKWCRPCKWRPTRERPDSSSSSRPRVFPYWMRNNFCRCWKRSRPPRARRGIGSDWSPWPARPGSSTRRWPISPRRRRLPRMKISSLPVSGGKSTCC